MFAFVSIPFREDLHSDKTADNTATRRPCDRFHPFQGRPSFGHTETKEVAEALKIEFPSLSGKTFIRTILRSIRPKVLSGLWFPSLSGKTFIRTMVATVTPFSDQKFPSLSGKTFIRTQNGRNVFKIVFYRVSIPFREDLHSDMNHGLMLNCVACVMFPSLSGKTFIRTQEYRQSKFSNARNQFPSLSGKTFIRTPQLNFHFR